MNVIEPAAGDQKRAYEFRRLNSTDLFLMFKIIGKIGVNEFASCFGKGDLASFMAGATGEVSEEDAATAVGISVILNLANVVIGNLPRCEAEIYQMLSNTSNLTVKQVKELEFATFAEMVIDFVKKDEFKDFISVVLRLFKQEN